MDIGTIVFWIVLAFLVFSVVGIFNGLVRGRNAFKNAFAQIDVQLQRRYDLIPNLVETAKGYLQHERETLEAVISARNQAQSAARAAAAHPEDGGAVGALGAAEGMLGAALGRFFALSEAYPDLKANQTMEQLMEELSSTENKIAFSRQAFNDAVMSFNNQREQFPNNFIAGPFEFPGSANVGDRVPGSQAGSEGRFRRVLASLRIACLDGRASYGFFSTTASGATQNGSARFLFLARAGVDHHCDQRGAVLRAARHGLVYRRRVGMVGPALLVVDCRRYPRRRGGW